MRRRAGGAGLSRRKAKRALARRIQVEVPFHVFAVDDNLGISLFRPYRCVWIKRHQADVLRAALEHLASQPTSWEELFPWLREYADRPSTGEGQDASPVDPSGEKA